jgi:flagellar basal-body rod modification protein FlgD
MPVSSVATTGSQPTVAADQSLGKQEFLRILLMQLRNQDPLNPINDREFITQMAQLSALEATTNLSGQVERLVASQHEIQVVQLVGHEVEYVDPAGERVRGRVDGVRFDGGAPILVIGDRRVPAGWVDTVF